MSIEKTVHWLFDHVKLLVILTICGIVMLLIGNFFSSNAFIYLEVTGNKNNKSIVSYAVSDTDNIKMEGEGLLLVPRKTKGLLVTAGENARTQLGINFPWYGFTRQKVELSQDMNAEKVAYRSTTGATCTTYSVRLDKLLYFSCRNPKAILTYDTPSDKAWGVRKIADVYYSGTEAKPYRSGVIGVAHIEATDSTQPGDIVYTTDEGKPVSYEAPDEIDESTIKHTQIFTDTFNPSNKNFVLVDNTGTIYLGTPTNSNKVSYKTIAAPTNYSSDYNQTLCSVANENVYCYRGRTAVGDLPSDFKFDNIAGFSIVSASFENTDISDKPLSDGLFSFTDFYTVDGKLYGKRYKKLFAFELQNSQYVMNELLQNVDAATGGDNLHVIQNGGVYVLNSKNSTFHQVFYSDNILPKAVYSSDDKTFIIGTIKGNSKVTYAYLLTNDQNTTPGRRLIDVLPTATSSITGSTGNDLVGNRLFITLPVVTTKSTKGQAGINTGEMEARKVDVLNALKGQDIPINVEDVQFTY